MKLLIVELLAGAVTWFFPSLVAAPRRAAFRDGSPKFVANYNPGHKFAEVEAGDARVYVIEVVCRRVRFSTRGHGKVLCVERPTLSPVPPLGVFLCSDPYRNSFLSRCTRKKLIFNLPDLLIRWPELIFGHS